MKITANETSFTPGPWVMTVWTTGRRTVECRTGLVLAEVHVTHEAPEQEANARLMAAAPELYDALMSTFAYITGLEHFGVKPEGVVEPDMVAVRAALAKAVQK